MKKVDNNIKCPDCGNYDGYKLETVHGYWCPHCKKSIHLTDTNHINSLNPITGAFCVALFVLFLNGREVYYKLVSNMASTVDIVDIVILSLLTFGIYKKE